MTWLEETTDALQQIGGSGHVQDIYKYISEHTARKLKRNWKASVRKTLEIHSSDSKAYDGNKDLFQSVEGINKGYWKIRYYIHQPMLKAADREELDDKFPDKILSTIYRFQRDTKMIRELKALYQDRCQICNLTINIKKRSYSEGHHLRPLGKSHRGPDSKNNILILCPNHHVLFDYGVIAINEIFQIVHIDPNDPLNGKTIDMKHELALKHIKYHLKKIFDQ